MSSTLYPLISIVIPTYNRAYCISKAITSVINQRYKNWELIVVDNFSNDDTESVIRNFDDLRIQFFSFANHGIIASARNYGLSKASGHYAAFLDSDDWWHELKLLEFSRYFPAHPALIFSDLFAVNTNTSSLFNKQQLIRRRPLIIPFTVDLLSNINPIVTSTVLVNIQLFKQVGCFNESPDFVTVEDLDAWIKLTQISTAIYHVPLPLTFYNLTSDGLSRSSLFIKNSRRYFRFHSISSLGVLRYPVWLLYSQALYFFRLASFKKSFLYSRVAFYSLWYYRHSLNYSSFFLFKLLILFLISFLFVIFASLF